MFLAGEIDQFKIIHVFVKSKFLLLKNQEELKICTRRISKLLIFAKANYGIFKEKFRRQISE